MEQFVQQVASGLANGAIYACVALALVMIYVSTDHINFAQGEMAMFSTYLSWQLMTWGVSFWVAFIIIDKITPYDLWREIVEKQNKALGMVVAAMCLGISIIVAAAIH